MNRKLYFDYIEEKLSLLKTQIESRGKLNILDLNVHSEDFYLHLLNRLFGWSLENLNNAKLNVEAIDLIDKGNRICVQVSAIATRQKIESALRKVPPAYKGYSFKFIAISADATKLRGLSYENSQDLIFDPNADIYDNKSILHEIKKLEASALKGIQGFFRDELGNEADYQRVETNLARIIKILASEDWDSPTDEFQTKPFEIEQKIDYNELGAAKGTVDDYAANSTRLNIIYEEFDKQGVNKSRSVLNHIRRIYLTNVNSKDSDELFFEVIEQVIRRIQSSTNYEPIAYEELEMSASILVVDAFIRCKIFKNPSEETYAAAG